jgi:oligopeptide/dipeptide ABC transporter ATP-binding protein
VTGTDAILSVRELTTVSRTRGGDLPIVKRVSFDVSPGEAVALVGESGSGKSLTMLSVIGLLPDPVVLVAGGEVIFEGTDLLTAGEKHRRSVRGARMAMVYQDPMTSLNPLMRIGDQISEGLRAHGIPKAHAHRRTVEALKEVGIPKPERAVRAFPHEFSGGMRQRAMIAMALTMSPRLLIADEPTTALDVTIQEQIISLVKRLQEDRELAVVWVTHDLGVVARLAQRVMVMYAGHIVEQGPTERVFRAPEHPYTDMLLGTMPPLQGTERPPLLQIEGTPPDPGSVPSGCPFRTRCPQAVDRCAEEMPPLTERGGGAAAACWVPPERWES